ncbi:MAG: acylphosphatase [Lentisphaerae bacterium]|nr:acylphosphatase [Lentisphaerota bacterium]
MSGTLRQVRVIYEGEVQGVGFRYTVCGIAGRLGVAGGVENRNDGTVRLVAEGREETLKSLLLHIRASRLAPYIENERVEWGDAEGAAGFTYR